MKIAVPSETEKGETRVAAVPDTVSWPESKQRNSRKQRREENVMHDQFSNAQQIRKQTVVSTGGIVAAQSRKAAEVGVEVMATGGDCVANWPGTVALHIALPVVASRADKIPVVM